MCSGLPRRPCTSPTCTTWVLVIFPALKDTHILQILIYKGNLSRYLVILSYKEVYYHYLITKTFFLPSITADGHRR